MLVALAGLAERASGRSAAVRCLVLWLLRQAETVARDFVEGGPDAPSASMPVAAKGAGPREAMRLASSLRALARQLRDHASVLAAAAQRMRDEPAALPCDRMPVLRDALAALSRLAALAPGAPHPAPDTS